MNHRSRPHSRAHSCFKYGWRRSDPYTSPLTYYVKVFFAHLQVKHDCFATESHSLDIMVKDLRVLSNLIQFQFPEISKPTVITLLYNPFSTFVCFYERCSYKREVALSYPKPVANIFLAMCDGSSVKGQNFAVRSELGSVG